MTTHIHEEPIRSQLVLTCLFSPFPIVLRCSRLTVVVVVVSFGCPAVVSGVRRALAAAAHYTLHSPGKLRGVISASSVKLDAACCVLVCFLLRYEGRGRSRLDQLRYTKAAAIGAGGTMLCEKGGGGGGGGGRLWNPRYVRYFDFFFHVFRFLPLSSTHSLGKRQLSVARMRHLI